jgi:CheY-like chemotaxis protein
MTKKINLVLLIDDNEDDNFFHRRAMEKAGRVELIDVCLDGSDALAYLQNFGKYAIRGPIYPRPDLIFLDINMPRTNGWEFLDQYALLDAQFVGGPIIVMLTTSLNPNDRQRAESYSLVSEFMTKPLKQQTFLEILDKHFPSLR